MAIKCVYFDVGGVIVKDFSNSNKWRTVKNKIGIPVELDAKFDAYFDKIEKEVVCGIPLENYIVEINKVFRTALPVSMDFVKVFVDLFETNPGIEPVLKIVSNVVEVGLFTNMYPGMFEKIERAKLIPEIYFNIIVDSSLEGVNKPSEEIFRIAQNRVGFMPDEILFVDNTIRHVNKAIELGWRGYHYDSTNYEDANQRLAQYVREVLS